MSDSCNGFTLDRFLACLKQYGEQLSAVEVAHLCHVSVRQVLCVAHHNQWDIQPVTGDWPSWKYQKRQTVAKSMRAADWAPKVYNDSGIVKRSPKAVTK